MYIFASQDLNSSKAVRYIVHQMWNALLLLVGTLVICLKMEIVLLLIKFSERLLGESNAVILSLYT